MNWDVFKTVGSQWCFDTVTSLCEASRAQGRGAPTHASQRQQRLLEQGCCFVCWPYKQGLQKGRGGMSALMGPFTPSYGTVSHSSHCTSAAGWALQQRPHLLITLMRCKSPGEIWR